jgi:hypothetical protein
MNHGQRNILLHKSKDEKIATLTAQRDALLAALKAIMLGVAGCQKDPEWEAARATIAKAEGK